MPVVCKVIDRQNGIKLERLTVNGLGGVWNQTDRLSHIKLLLFYFILFYFTKKQATAVVCCSVHLERLYLIHEQETRGVIGTISRIGSDRQ